MSLKCKIETVLFVTAKAMTVEEIAEILKEDPEKVEAALVDLLMDYSSRDSALEIDDEDGYIIQVRHEYSDIVERLVPVELKPSVLRTLTVIAIKEPIRQSKIIELRGQTAYDHIGDLIEKGLISKKRDKTSRAYILRTTSKFAEYFKLKGDTQALAKLLDIEMAEKSAEKSRVAVEAEIEEFDEGFDPEDEA